MEYQHLVQPEIEVTSELALDPSLSFVPKNASPSAWRAWIYLVCLCLQRQARARQMVWIALALLGFTTTVVMLVTASDGWGLEKRRWTTEVFTIATSGGQKVVNSPMPHSTSRLIVQDFGHVASGMELAPHLGIWSIQESALQVALASTCQVVLSRSGVMVFSNWVVFSVFLSFLLPIWSLSFATDTLGGEREEGTLVWLLTRPLSRPGIYLAKFIALLPWALGLNLAGFGLLCLAAGKPGYQAFQWYWPGVFWGTLTFCALFHLMSACCRRPAVVAIGYSFFLETLVGNMPGYMKRISISFYTRCLMFEPLHRNGLTSPEKDIVYVPVDGATALWVLILATVVLLVIGMAVFARLEYQDLS